MARVKSPWIFIWIALVVFIFYGTLIPFDLKFTFANHTLLFFQGLGGRLRPSIPDAVSNILLYGLYGFLYCYAIRMRSKLAHFMSCLILGVSMSLFTEWLQAFSISRVSSRVDVVMNVFGVVLGYFSGRLDRNYVNPYLKDMIWGNSRKNPWLLLSIFWALSIIVASIAPFYVTLDVSYVYGGLKRLLSRSPFVLLYQQDYWVGAVDTAIRFLVLGYLMYRMKHQKNTETGINHVHILAFALIFPCMIEFSQLFFHYRVADFIDIFVSVIAFAGGFFIFSRISSKSALILVYTALLLLLASAPFQFGAAKTLSIHMFIPYESYSHETGLKPLEDIIEQATLFLPLGLLLYPLCMQTFYNKCTARLLVAKSFLIGWVIALVMEIIQIWVMNRHPEITDTITGALGCGLGTYIMVQYDKRIYM
ncbi:MAG: VanZ family protein [Chlamydiota bacterium]|nr:VanZ family protein [Chlamydiota bacterium]